MREYQEEIKLYGDDVLRVMPFKHDFEDNAFVSDGMARLLKNAADFMAHADFISTGEYNAGKPFLDLCASAVCHFVRAERSPAPYPYNAAEGVSECFLFRHCEEIAELAETPGTFKYYSGLSGFMEGRACAPGLSGYLRFLLGEIMKDTLAGDGFDITVKNRYVARLNSPDYCFAGEMQRAGVSPEKAREALAGFLNPAMEAGRIDMLDPYEIDIAADNFAARFLI